MTVERGLETEDMSVVACVLLHLCRHPARALQGRGACGCCWPLQLCLTTALCLSQAEDCWMMCSEPSVRWDPAFR